MARVMTSGSVSKAGRPTLGGSEECLSFHQSSTNTYNETKKESRSSMAPSFGESLVHQHTILAPSRFFAITHQTSKIRAIAPGGTSIPSARSLVYIVALSVVPTPPGGRFLSHPSSISAMIFVFRSMLISLSRTPCATTADVGHLTRLEHRSGAGPYPAAPQPSETALIAAFVRPRSPPAAPAQDQ